MYALQYQTGKCDNNSITYQQNDYLSINGHQKTKEMSKLKRKLLISKRNRDQKIYRIARIYYESFNFANFANRKALAKIKASIYFWINIVQTKCIASN